ncbi:MAG: bifunctional glutamate N-acetyltransferase/amino-acid acetyltransferase ArgJ [Candidatus Hydrogenedentota bacterium]
MNITGGGVCAPAGFSAAGAAAGIKNPDKPRLDCALIASEAPCVATGVFTTNQVKAAPVIWDEHVCARGTARALFANSGNANACTGEQGVNDVHDTAARVAQQLGLQPDEVLIASTGVIGVPLPMARLIQGVDDTAAALSTSGGDDAAHAIMTTDTVPKTMACTLKLGGVEARIGAMAKGAGMIAPNMATMLCFITTDAAIGRDDLRNLVRACVDRSFNRICVDNDMSTNDTVLCLANGRAGNAPLVPATPEYEQFSRALEHTCGTLAEALVRDGEGASKLVIIEVTGAASDADARAVARSVAHSQLCKTAFAGEDPNWGRIACAVGYAPAQVDAAVLDLYLGEVQVVAGGTPTAYREEDAAAHMRENVVHVRAHLGLGAGACTFKTTDLSHDYVRINADYRT